MTDPPPGRSFRIVLATTFATFCALYAPQPLLPLLGDELGASPARTALLMTSVLVPLALAPLLYGALLGRLAARTLLLAACAALGALQLALAAAPDFGTLLGLRALQGCLFPAILTAAVTYCSRAGDAGAIARRVSLYVATTILGGLAGRLVGGVSSDLIGWRATFALLGLALLGCALVLPFAARDARRPNVGGDLAAVASLLGTGRVVAGLALVFAVFLAFSGYLNTLPFRLVELEPGLASGRIARVYAGYAVGVAVALNAARLVRLAGGPVRALAAALLVFLVGLSLAFPAGERALVAIGFVVSGGMFAVHATLSGYLNGLRPDASGLVNGLYIAVYYAAGAIGSVLGPWLYQRDGWTLALAVLLGVAACGILPLAALARLEPRAARA